MISFYLCNLVTHKGNDASLAKQEFPFIDTDSDIDSILNHKPIVCCLLRSESKLHKQSGNRKETVFFSFFVIVALLLFTCSSSCRIQMTSHNLSKQLWI